MAKKMINEPDTLSDPIVEHPGYEETESLVGLWGHPLHAMSVAFPVALTCCACGADLFYWWSGELFWARAAIWAAGTALLLGLLAGATGTAALLLVPGIRLRAPAWPHKKTLVKLLRRTRCQSSSESSIRATS